jgi:uncharacterized protein (TIGR02996 family)
MRNTDHPEYVALLRAICAEPDDDTPRLVAADWLEEHGDADRAAFIRIQVELARLEASGLGKSFEADTLRKKERAYFGPYSYFWRLWAAEACPQLVRVNPGRPTSPLSEMSVEGADQLTFGRGFVEQVRCPAAEWLRHGAAVRARQPVRRAELTDCAGLTRDDWYAGMPALRGLVELIVFDARSGLAAWLEGRLPGTTIQDPPF